MADSPLLDFDPNPKALLEPTEWYRPIKDLPTTAVITWMRDAFEALLDEYPSKLRHRLGVETAEMPIHEVEIEGRSTVVALSHGGARAAAILYEALIAMGRGGGGHGSVRARDDRSASRRPPRSCRLPGRHPAQRSLGSR